MPSVTAEALVFFTVTTCAAVVEPTVVEAKVRVVGDTVTVRAAATPVPVRATVCGDPVALSVKEMAPVAEPAAAGSKSADTVQLAPAASVPVQVFVVITKSVEPVIAMVLSVAEAAPVFLTVTDCAAVVVPTVVDAKVRLVGVKLSVAVEVVVGHAFTRLVTLGVPRPVVWSYPTPAV